MQEDHSPQCNQLNTTRCSWTCRVRLHPRRLSVRSSHRPTEVRNLREGCHQPWNSLRQSTCDSALGYRFSSTSSSSITAASLPSSCQPIDLCNATQLSGWRPVKPTESELQRGKLLLDHGHLVVVQLPAQGAHVLLRMRCASGPRDGDRACGREGLHQGIWPRLAHTPSAVTVKRPGSIAGRWSMPAPAQHPSALKFQGEGRAFGHEPVEGDLGDGAAAIQRADQLHHVQQRPYLQG